MKIFSNDYYQNVNKFSILIGVIYGYYFFLLTLSNGFKGDSIIYLATAVLSFAVAMINKRTSFSIRYFKIGLFVFYIYLNALHIYTAGCYSGQVSVDNFQYAILSSLLIFYDVKTDKKIILSLALLTCLCIFAIQISSQTGFFSFNYTIEKSQIQIVNFSNLGISTFIIFHNFIFLLQQQVYFEESKEKRKLILAEARQKISVVNSREIEDLLDIAKLNSVLFLEKFSILFPDFFQTEYFNKSSLSTSELYICALTKLGLNSKDIAVLSNSTQKSVDSKKYRIKSKLNITVKFSEFFQ